MLERNERRPPFITKRELQKYQEHVSMARLPIELAAMQYTAEWPIRPNGKDVFITSFFGDRNYSAPEYRHAHNAIDIQAHAGKTITSPCDGSIIAVMPDERRNNGLGGIIIYDDHSGIAWTFDHINIDAISDPLKALNVAEKFERSADKKIISSLSVPFDSLPHVSVRRGQPFSTIGNWPNELNETVALSQEIEQIHGRSYHHVHVETTHHSSLPKNYLELINKDPFNPLLLFTQL